MFRSLKDSGKAMVSHGFEFDIGDHSMEMEEPATTYETKRKSQREKVKAPQPGTTFTFTYRGKASGRSSEKRSKMLLKSTPSIKATASQRVLKGGKLS